MGLQAMATVETRHCRLVDGPVDTVDYDRGLPCRLGCCGTLCVALRPSVTDEDSSEALQWRNASCGG